ncbi:hypothetical protein [Phenylobacterium sp.]|uniref:hypothetical protein n=1 Tax=Phenylobacterium sp. TaxID=1871053 RepID=UPI0035B068E5
MEKIEILAERASRRRRRSDVPLIATPQEARAIAREIADRLAAVSGDQRLLLLSALNDLHRGLTERIEQLDEDMRAERAAILSLNQGLQAHARYAPTRRRD